MINQNGSFGFYDKHIFCCTNERKLGHPRGCCAEKNAFKLRAYMKAKAKTFGIENIRINTSGCLDRCELGPTMVIYPDNVWYTYQTREDIDEILNVHIINGKVVERLVLKRNQNKLHKAND